MASFFEFFLFFVIWCFFCSMQLIFGFMNWRVEDVGNFFLSLPFFFVLPSVLWSEMLVYSAKFIITGGGNLFTKRELPLGDIFTWFFECVKPVLVEFEMFCNKHVATRFGFQPVYVFTPLTGRHPFQIPPNLVEVIVIDDDDEIQLQVLPAPAPNQNNNNNNIINNNNNNNNNNNPLDPSDVFLTPPEFLTRALLIGWGYYPVHHLLLLIAASYVCPVYSSFLVSFSVATMQVQIMAEEWVRRGFLSWQQLHSLVAFTNLHNPATASANIQRSKKMYDKYKWFMFRTLLLQFLMAVGLTVIFGFCAYHVFVDGDLGKKLASSLAGSPPAKNLGFLHPPEVRCAKYHPALTTLRKIERALLFLVDYNEGAGEQHDAVCNNIQTLYIDNSAYEGENEAKTKKRGTQDSTTASTLNFGKVLHQIPTPSPSQLPFISRKSFDDVLALLLIEFFGQALRAWIQFAESLLVVVFKLWHDFPSMGEKKYFCIKLFHRGTIFFFALLVVFQLNGYWVLELISAIPLEKIDGSVLFPYYSSQNSNLFAKYPCQIHSCRGLYETILLAQNNENKNNNNNQKKLQEFASSILLSSASNFSLSAILCLNLGHGLHETFGRITSISSTPVSETRKYYDSISGLTLTANINKNKNKGSSGASTIRNNNNPPQQQASKLPRDGPFPLFSQIILATLAYIFFKSLNLFVDWHTLLLSFHDLTPERFREHVRARRMKIRDREEADRRHRAEMEQVVQNAMAALSRSVSRARSESPEERGGLPWSLSPPRMERSLSNVSNVSDVVDTQCLICLEEIDVKTCRGGVKILHCGHFFHEICLGKAVLSGKYRCPACRDPF